MAVRQFTKRRAVARSLQVVDSGAARVRSPCARPSSHRSTDAAVKALAQVSEQLHRAAVLLNKRR